VVLAACIVFATAQWLLATAGPGQAYARCALSEASKLERALVDCTEAIGQEPGRPFPYAQRCWAHVNRNELDEAIADCDAALGRGIADARHVHALRCEARFGKRDFQGAIDDCSDALDVHTASGLLPRYIATLYRIRCDSYGALGQVPAAIADCREASERGSIEGYLRLAWWQIAARQWDEAIAAAARGGQALAANPAQSDARSVDWYRPRLRTMQAHALFPAGRMEEALAIYRELRQDAGAGHPAIMTQALEDFGQMRATGLIDAANGDQARQIEALLAAR
jgi:tetratricopeptide (TPR) repeat protein